MLAVISLIAGTGFAQSSAPPAAKKPSASKKPMPAAPALQLEPKALAILKATSDGWPPLILCQFTAIELFENLTRQDVPLGYTAKYEVTLQRPDKLRVLKPADGPANSFYYDGKSMTGYAPAENLLAVADAPPTIDATLEKAYKLAGIYLPFDDLIVAESVRRPRSPDWGMPIMSASPTLYQEPPPTSWPTPAMACLCRCGLVRMTNCLGWCVRFSWTILTTYATSLHSRIGNWMNRYRRIHLLRPARQLRQSVSRLPLLTQQLPAKRQTSGQGQARKATAMRSWNMKHKIIVSCLSLAIALLPLEKPWLIRTRTATAAAPRIVTGPPSHSSAYGTSTSHTYGEGSSHTNEYGGSTSHNYYGGTSHTNTYGGTTSGEAGYGATHTYDNGATAYHAPDPYYGYHPPTTAYVYHPPAPYYPGCYDCGSTAGAAAVGAMVGMATGAAIAAPRKARPPRRTPMPRAIQRRRNHG